MGRFVTSPLVKERALAVQVFAVRDSQGNLIAEKDGRWKRILRDLRKARCAEDPQQFVLDLLEKRQSGYGAESRMSLRQDISIKSFDGGVE